LPADGRRARPAGPLSHRGLRRAHPGGGHARSRPAARRTPPRGRAPLWPSGFRYRRMRRSSPVLFVAVLSLTAGRLLGQQISDLEPERPVALEDARPGSYPAFSGSADRTYNARKDSRDDYGPGFSLLYGALRRLEVGASVRYVTSPSSNANRGISSGDIRLHVLYGLATEGPSLPALAVRLGVEFPTGLDSKGTDLHAGLLATHSFDIIRLHVNGLWTHLGDAGAR